MIERSRVIHIVYVERTRSTRTVSRLSLKLVVLMKTAGLTKLKAILVDVSEDAIRWDKTLFDGTRYDGLTDGEDSGRI